MPNLHSSHFRGYIIISISSACRTGAILDNSRVILYLFEERHKQKMLSLLHCTENHKNMYSNSPWNVVKCSTTKKYCTFSIHPTIPHRIYQIFSSERVGAINARRAQVKRKYSLPKKLSYFYFSTTTEYIPQIECEWKEEERKRKHENLKIK